MRTKNELYQEALRTVARRRQTARAKACLLYTSPSPRD